VTDFAERFLAPHGGIPRPPEKKTSSHRSGEVSERLVQFLYLLGGDSLALGVAEAIFERTTADEAVYSNEHLAAWARDLAQRLESLAQ
jgi:hypothetical protein